MKRLIDICSIVACTVFSVCRVHAQTTVIDNSGDPHIFKYNSTFHEHNNEEIFLHHWVLFAEHKMNYWHAKTIQAGYHLGSNHIPRTGFTAYTDPLYSEQFGSSMTSWMNNHPSSGNDLTWYEGFYIADAFQNPCGNSGPCWKTTGDADLTATNLQVPTNHPDYNTPYWPQYPPTISSGAVIFRADELIILSDGFRASYNPTSRQNNTRAYSIASLSTNATTHEVVITTTEDHHYFTGDIVGFQPHITRNDLGSKLHKITKRSNTSFSLDGSIENFTNDNIDVPSNCSTVRVGGNVPDNVYFHAYAGADRFDCEDLWQTPQVTDFTSTSTTLPTSLFARQDRCSTSPTDKADPYDPGNATFTSSGPRSLDLAFKPVSYDCSLTDLRPFGAGGIGTGWIDHDNISPKEFPRHVLSYGKVDFETKFPTNTTHNVALWSYHNFDDSSIIGGSGSDFAGSDEIDGVDCDAGWFAGQWDSRVQAVVVTNGGSGYATGTTVTFSSPDVGSNVATANVVVGTGGVIESIDMTSPGSGYFKDASITSFSSTPTVQCTVQVFMESSWPGGVGSIIIVDKGLDYDPLTTTVSFSGGGGGSGADAEPIINTTTGEIESIVIKNRGSGYSFAPKVIINDGGNPPTTPAKAYALTKSFGEDDVYHYLVGNFTKLPYAANPTTVANGTYANIGGSRAFLVSFKDIPGNSETADEDNNWHSFSDAFHTYNYEWLPGEIRYQIEDASSPTGYKEIGRTTRHVPLVLRDPFGGKTGMNVLAKSQWNRDITMIGTTSYVHQTEEHMLVNKITISDFDESDPCGVLANKQARPSNPSVSRPMQASKLFIGSINPNPAQAQISFDITIKTPGNFPAMMEIFNTLGHLVLKLFEGQIPDQSNFTFPVRDLQSGTYYLRVTSGIEKATKSFVIQR